MYRLLEVGEKIIWGKDTVYAKTLTSEGWCFVDRSLDGHIVEEDDLPIRRKIPSHNSAMDAIFAAAKEWDDGHNNRAAINGFIAGVEWSQKQHQ